MHPNSNYLLPLPLLQAHNHIRLPQSLHTIRTISLEVPPPKFGADIWVNRPYTSDHTPPTFPAQTRWPLAATPLQCAQIGTLFPLVYDWWPHSATWPHCVASVLSCRSSIWRLWGISNEVGACKWSLQICANATDTPTLTQFWSGRSRRKCFWFISLLECDFDAPSTFQCTVPHLRNG